MDPPILRHQKKFNRATRDAWEPFGPHRARVMACIAPAGGRLAVLGAGNANDLDLARLATDFDEVHLVDLDADALAAGVERQGVPRDAFHLHGGFDLSGVSAHLDAFWGDAPVDGARVDAALAAAREAAPPAIGGPFDVVVSTCLLTQLVDQVVHSLGPEHAGTRRLATAVRDRHVELLCDLARPGGRAVLVTDALSTSVEPELATLPEAALGGLLRRRERGERCFAGTHPGRVEAALAAHPGVANTRRSGPWRWAVGSLTFLVYALTARLRAARAP